MDTNSLCQVIILISCIWLLIFHSQRAWKVKSLLLLLLLGADWWLYPDRAGLIAIGPWIVLNLIPTWLQYWSIRLLVQRHLKAAAFTSRLLTWLHPWSGNRTLRQRILVISSLLRGDLEGGRKLADHFQLQDPGLSNLASVLQLQCTGEWAEYEERMSARPSESLTDPSLLAGRLMATAQLGKWDQFASLCGTLAQASFLSDQDVSLKLRAWAYLGDLDAVQVLLRTSGNVISREVREFWLAVAEQMSGQTQVGRNRLLHLRYETTATVRPMVDRQLESGPISPPDPESRRQAQLALQPARRVIENDMYFALMSGLGRFPIMTTLLSLALIAVFVTEIPGGSEDLENLVSMGALVVPPLGEPLEWTRRITCGFLHFGPVHLGMNLLGLWFLGTSIERGWGRWGLLALFLTCISVSGMLLPALTGGNPDETEVFAGASGGVMGLLGAIWGSLLIGRLGAATPRIRQQFRTATSFVGLQAASDMLMPGVSMTCHMLGLATGIAMGIGAGLIWRRRLRSRCNDFSEMLSA